MAHGSSSRKYGGDNYRGGGSEQGYNSYQSGSPRGYQPPPSSGTYADQQTNVLEDTMRTHYEAEGTANTVLAQLTSQRQQLKGANDNVWEMRQAAEKAQKEIKRIDARIKRRKRKLQFIIIVLAVTNLFLFFRLIKCGGSFFCKSKQKNAGNNDGGYYNNY